MRQTLDDFMKRPAEAEQLRATIVPGPDPESVEITPWTGSGCGCDAALVLPKSVVGHVSPTGDRHLCCGKLLPVVDVEFVASAAWLHSVFAQLLARRTIALARKGGAGASGDCELDCGQEFQSCRDGCDPRDEGCWLMCRNNLSRCLRGCRA